MLKPTNRRVILAALAIAAASVIRGADAGSQATARTVINEDQDTARSFGLVPDLVIGVKDGDEKYVLGEISDIAVDSQGSIYVLDRGYQRIQQYDSAGSYLRSIGRAGPGPGEFQFPTALAIDRQSRNLYVGDLGRVFDTTSGTLSREFRHDFPQGIIRGMRVDHDGNIFLSCFDMHDQQVIHKYDVSGKHMVSFCKFGNGDVNVERSYAGGRIDIGKDGSLYYSQINPYEIREFSLDGVLMLKIVRKNGFMHPPEVKRDGATQTLGLVTGAFTMVAPKGKIINVVNNVVDKSAANPLEERATIFDVFDRDGQLLASKRVKGTVTLQCADNDGKVYGQDLREYPRVVRYVVIL